MPSPFPGMNPYFEQPALWQDFHTKFLAALNERLVPQVRPRYFVLLERYLYVHEPHSDSNPQRMRADLLVASRPGLESGTAVLDLEAPIRVRHAEPEVEQIAYLEIRGKPDGELVTLVELLSMANKRDDLSHYLAKREAVLSSPAHLVEIDLLRGGRPMPETDRPPCDYSVLVSRAERRPDAGFWPISLRQKLPTIPIPLAHGDPDARIDLQELIDHVYDTYGYDYFLYDSPPTPPLSEADKAWAGDFVPKST